MLSARVIYGAVIQTAASVSAAVAGSTGGEAREQRMKTNVERAR